MLVSFDSFKTVLNAIFNRLSATEKKLDVFEEDVTESIDALIEARPDWSQNDPKQLDYIKNRPFFDSEPIFATTINATDASSGRVDCSLSTPLLMDRLYTVIFNGIPSVLPCEVFKIVPSGTTTYSCGFESAQFRLYSFSYDYIPASLTKFTFFNLRCKATFPITIEIYEGLAINPKHISWGNNPLYNNDLSLNNEQKERAVSNIGAQEVLCSPKYTPLLSNITIKANGVYTVSTELTDVSTYYLGSSADDSVVISKCISGCVSFQDGGIKIYSDRIENLTSYRISIVEFGKIEFDRATTFTSMEGSGIAVDGYAHAEGTFTYAGGTNSHAEGYNTGALGKYSHAEGSFTKAHGESSHAEGWATNASGDYSHAEGGDTDASGDYSHAEGSNTTAASESQHVQGKYNIEDADDIYAHIVGNGTSWNARSNAHTLGWDGTAWFAGDVYVGSVSGKNKDNGSKKLATEDFVQGAKNYIILTDSINSYDYIIQMQDGNLTSICKIDSISATVQPTKTEYVVGDTFDPAGMVITATAQDGSTRPIENYSCPERIMSVVDSVEIQYVECDTTYTVSIPITVTPFDAATDLIDFEYTSNDDGTYTITSWKGTLNGVASTEMVVPDNGLIIV